MTTKEEKIIDTLATHQPATMNDVYYKIMNWKGGITKTELASILSKLARQGTLKVVATRETKTSYGHTIEDREVYKVVAP